MTIYLLKKFHCLLTSPLFINFLGLKSQDSKTKTSTYLSAYVYLMFQPNESGSLFLVFLGLIPTPPMSLIVLQSGMSILTISKCHKSSRSSKASSRISKHL